LDVGATREQPRCVGVAQVVEPNFEGQPGFLEGRGPDFLSEPRTRDMTIGVETAGLSRLVFPGGPG